MKQINFKLTEATTNKKLTGGKANKFVSATTSSWLTCSNACPLFKDCYAKKGYHQKLHADKVTSGARGYEFKELCNEIMELRPGSLLRLNVSGDLPSEDYSTEERKIDINKLLDLKLSASIAKAKTYTYTHLHCDNKNKEWNLKACKSFSDKDFVINISTENKRVAAKLYHEGHDVVITDTKLFNFAVEHQQTAGKKATLVTKEGTVDLFPCDAQYKESNCAKCKKCAEYNRSELVIFKKH